MKAWMSVLLAICPFISGLMMNSFFDAIAFLVFHPNVFNFATYSHGNNL